MTIIKKFTPEEAGEFLRSCREEQEAQPKSWCIRYGQTVVNRLRTEGKLLDPIPEIFYTTDDLKVDEWFWTNWVQIQTIE